MLPLEWWQVGFGEIDFGGGDCSFDAGVGEVPRAG